MLVLQWSRCSSAAERPSVSYQDPSRTIVLQWSRCSSAAERSTHGCTSTRRSSRFNGAAARRQRRALLEPVLAGLVEVLQWSRCSSAAERSRFVYCHQTRDESRCAATRTPPRSSSRFNGAAARRQRRGRGAHAPPRPHGGASMEPLLVGSGEASFARAARSAGGVLQWSRCSSAAESCAASRGARAGAQVLQWSRCSSAAERRSLRREGLRRVLASMEPLLVGSGEFAETCLNKFANLTLQWSRCSSAAESRTHPQARQQVQGASMEPLLVGSGELDHHPEPLVNHGPASMEPLLVGSGEEFEVPCAREELELQWSRCSSAAESDSGMREPGPAPVASMEPLLVGSGEEANGKRWRRAYTTLQWSRCSSAAESDTIVGIRPEYLASMEPLLVGSGEAELAAREATALLDASMEPLLVGSGESGSGATRTVA